MKHTYITIMFKCDLGTGWVDKNNRFGFIFNS